jgi:type III pantothenate kinase
MNLIIDVGNSLVKSAVFQRDKYLKTYWASLKDFPEKFQEIKKEYPEIRFSIVSSVVKDISWIEEVLKKETRLFVLDEEIKLPFKNKYATPQTLGKDRIALVAAGAKQYQNKNLLIIDAGTCITFDFKNDKNEYLGGAISPGVEMRFKALHQFTANLPFVEFEGEAHLIGDSTQNSILSGVVNGAVAEIDGLIERYRVENKYLTVILTGGNAQFLSKRVKNSIFANPNFLLEGLNYILESNKTQ